jgi:hypothetical protein
MKPVEMMMEEGVDAMKKIFLVVAAVLTLVAAFGFAGYAYAQAPTPPNRYPGMMGGRGHMGGMMNGSGAGSGWMGGMMGTNGAYGPMHEYMLKALAEKLNLTTDEIQTRLNKGETMWDIARSQGISDTEISTLMNEAHDQALADAVAAGVITQEQADWMDSHMEQMLGNGFSGGCHGGARQNTTSTGSNL